MLTTQGYAAFKSDGPLQPFTFDRREPGPFDVLINILYCGVCHSDIHTARSEWGPATYPVVPGHEIVGKVARVGNQVNQFSVGDTVGVGCFLDSCRSCTASVDGLEQYCQQGPVFTYNSPGPDGRPTYGGYSTRVVVDQKYVLRVPPSLPLERTAPLLCAGITTYSPLRHWNVGPSTRLGVMGLGWLGHMAVKLGVSMGAEVTVFSSSPSKEQEARRLGGHGFVLTSDENQMKKQSGRMDLMLDTVSAVHPLEPYLSALRRDGTLVLVGAPSRPLNFQPFSIIGERKSIAGSLIGGIQETQEMLNYCAQSNVAADVEVIPMENINTAYDRILAADVRYRFVIDIARSFQAVEIPQP